MNVKGRRQLTFVFTNTKTDMAEHNCSLSYFGEWSRRVIWAHEFKKKNKPTNWEHSEGNKTNKNDKGTAPFETAILWKQIYSATIQYRQIYAIRS